MNPLLSHALIGVTTLVLGICVGYTISDRKKFDYQVVQNVCVAVISLLALTGLLVGIHELKLKTECQSEYNKRFTTSLAERAEASDKERAAARAMIAGVMNPAATQESRSKAILEWDRALAEVDVARKLNPVPLPPGCIEGA